MEKVFHLTSLLDQDEDIICVAMWSCKSHENKLWFGKRVTSNGPYINHFPRFCKNVLTSFPSCCLNILEIKTSCHSPPPSSASPSIMP